MTVLTGIGCGVSGTRGKTSSKKRRKSRKRSKKKQRPEKKPSTRIGPEDSRSD